MWWLLVPDAGATVHLTVTTAASSPGSCAAIDVTAVAMLVAMALAMRKAVARWRSSAS